MSKNMTFGIRGKSSKWTVFSWVVLREVNLKPEILSDCCWVKKNYCSFEKRERSGN